MKRLPQTFYARDTRIVAKELLGKVLCAKDGANLRLARIVETEAYHGPKDAASHARAGKTARTSIMYGPAGFAYIYLIYGMYSCLNVVTEEEGFPSAVLLRAGEILGDPNVRAGAGPGKLCRALGLDRGQNGADLVKGDRLWIADDGMPRGRIRRGPRINVDYAGAWAERPWRFWIADHPSVSRRG